jgi:hypothetical protein
MPFFQVLEPRVKYFFHTAKFNAPRFLQGALYLREAAVQQREHEAIEDNVQDYRNSNRQVKLFVGHQPAWCAPIGFILSLSERGDGR